MFKSYFSKFIFMGLAAGLLFLNACATAGDPMAKTEAVSTPVDPNEPCWVQNVSCRDTETLLAVRGRAYDYANPQDAEADAILDAQRQAADVIAANINRIFDENTRGERKTNQQMIKGLAGDDYTAKLVKQKITNLRAIPYTRRWTVTQFGVQTETWESFALIVMPKDTGLNLAEKRLDLEAKKEPEKEPLVEKAKERLNEMRARGLDNLEMTR